MERRRPILRACLLCSGITRDADGDILSLIRPLHSLGVHVGFDGYRLSSDPIVYIQLEGGVGKFYLSVKVRRQGEPHVIWTTNQPVTFVSTGDGIVDSIDELVIDLPKITLPGPDVYEIHVYCNHMSFSEVSDAIPFPPMRLHLIPLERGG